MKTLTAIGIVTYGVLFVHFVVALLLMRKRDPIHRTIAAFLADFATMCIAGGLAIYSDYQILVPKVITLVAMSLMAPFSGAFVLLCLGTAKTRLRRRYALGVGIVTALTFSVCGLLLLQGVEWQKVSLIVYGLLFLVFLSLVGVEWYELRPFHRLSPGLRRFFALTVFDVLLVGGMLWARLVGNLAVLIFLWAVISVSLIVVALITFRYPGVYASLEAEAARLRSDRTRLSGVSVDQTLGTLTALMEGQGLYTDPHLSLESLAVAIGVTPPQLSELLNQRLGRNFASYVNEFRVEAAKKLLASSEGAGVLEVAFNCGFNSKSNFNAVFRRVTGMSPRRYRELALPSAGQGAPGVQRGYSTQ